MNSFYWIVMIIILTSLVAKGQSGVSNDTTVNKSNSINSAASRVEKSLKSSKKDVEVAGYYEQLAQELLKKGDTAKAEDYYNKALKFYRNSKDENKTADILRQLAKIQESQKRYSDAVSNYSEAGTLTSNKKYKIVNSNDAERVLYNSNPQKQLEIIQKNVETLEKDKTSDGKEKSQAYIQMAEVNKELEKPEAALKNLNQALLNTNSNSIDEKSSIINSMVDIYIDKNMFNKAIDLKKSILLSIDSVSDKQGKIKQLHQLAAIYFKYGKTQEGFKSLQDAYTLSLENGNLKDAKQSLQLLIAHYEKNKARDQIIPLYKNFVEQLDILIKSDSSIVDIKLFQITEDKIVQLEKERSLKDELIKRKNKFNYVLIASVLLLLVLLGLIIKAWNSIKNRNKKIALQSLRREMNPHFIFNSLNSINQFIASNNELQANKFLASYSNLMRNFMENSNKDFIGLNTEIEQLKKYLELEKLRFSEKFDFKIEIDEKVDVDSEKVPNMIIQPNLENAIWHGLRYKENKGLLLLKINKIENKLIILIEDNGIGLTKSSEIKTQNQRLHESRGLTNVRERIKLLNEIYKTNIKFEISEKTGQESGVVVKIEW